MNFKKTYIFALLLLFAVFALGSIKLFSAKKIEFRDIKTKKDFSASIYKEKAAVPTGAPPETSPASNLKIQKTEKVIDSVSTGQKIIALTFDADMTPGMEYDLKNGKNKNWYNEAVIRELNDAKTPATLFLTGLWIKNYPNITEELSKNPLFEIANHSYSHSAFTLNCYKLPAIADNLDEAEIIQAEDLLKRYAPNYKKYFRFPGLCSDDFDIREAQKLGYKIIGGDIKGLDGFNYNANSIVQRVVSRLAPGSIIILHMHGGPNAPRTAEALPEIIRQAKEKGYGFVTVSELLNN